MSNRSFMRIVRQYAALASRFRREYHEPVNAALSRRAESYVKQGLSGKELTTAVERDILAVSREYGQVRPEWSVSAADVLG